MTDTTPPFFSDKISSRAWADIPYFRKPWFFIVLFLVFMPFCLIQIWTGDLYYRKKEVVYSMGLKRTQFITLFILIFTALSLVKNLK